MYASKKRVSCSSPLFFSSRRRHTRYIGDWSSDVCSSDLFGSLSAQKPVWQPSPGHTQIPIWPGAAPDPQPVAGPEYAETSGKDFLPGGRPAVGVSNVTRPTMTVYSPKGKNTGAAVVVFPGGGYQV